MVTVQTILLATPLYRSESPPLRLFRPSQEPKIPVLISRSIPVTWFPMTVRTNYQGASLTLGPVPFDRQSTGHRDYVLYTEVCCDPPSPVFQRIYFFCHTQTIVYDLFKRMLGSGPVYVALGNHDTYHTWVLFTYIPVQGLHRILVHKMHLTP